jgi:hypothetical protein
MAENHEIQPSEPWKTPGAILSANDLRAQSHPGGQRANAGCQDGRPTGRRHGNPDRSRTAGVAAMLVRRLRTGGQQRKDNTGTWLSPLLVRTGTMISVIFLLPAAEQAAPAWCFIASKQRRPVERQLNNRSESVVLIWGAPRARLLMHRAFPGNRFRCSRGRGLSSRSCGRPRLAGSPLVG